MKIGTKLTLALAAPLVGLMAVFGWLQVDRSRTLLERELSDERDEVARVVQEAAEDSLTDTTPQTAAQLVDHVAGFTRIEGLRVFDEEGRLAYQSGILSKAPEVDRAALETALDRGEETESRLELEGEPVVGFVFPITRSDGGGIGAMQIFQRDAFIATEAGAARHAILLLTVAMIVAASAIVLVVIRYAVDRPIQELALRFDGVAAGELSTRVPVRSDDELGRLARAFNAMCAKLESARTTLERQEAERNRARVALRHAERMASLGRLAAGLAHELGTPLSVIAGRADSLRKKLHGNQPAERSLDIIIGQIDRIARTMRQVLDRSRSGEVCRAATSIPELCATILELLEPRLARTRVSVRTAFEPDLPPVEAERDRLDELFLNLAMNAIDSMQDGGELTVRVHEEHRPHRDPPHRPESFVVLTVEDQGCGIAPADLERVFEPFFTTKAVGEGTGLGLSLARGIATEHGGWLEIASTQGIGTRVAVFLPAMEQEARSRTAATPAPA